MSAPVPQSTRFTYLEVREGHPKLRVARLAQEEVPEPELTGLGLEFCDNGDHGLPPVLGVSRQLGVGNLLGRQNLVLAPNSISATLHVKKGALYMNEGDELRESFLRIGRELVLNLPLVNSHSRIIDLPKVTIAHADGDANSSIG